MGLKLFRVLVDNDEEAIMTDWFKLAIPGDFPKKSNCLRP
jgi:hypothetical protein